MMRARSVKHVLAALVAILLFVAPVGAQVVEYYHLDALGSVRAVTDGSGEVISRHDYLPYGEEWNPQASHNTRRFTSQERDEESGLDYFGGRFYGPSWAVFTSVDPVTTFDSNVADPQRWNRYAYARGNPQRFVDPDGRVLDTIADVAFIAYDVYEIGRKLVNGEGVSRTDVLALGADVVGAAVPFASGGGAAVRAVSKADDVVDLVKGADRVADGRKAAKAAKTKNATTKTDTLQPGSFANESVPARGPGRNFTKAERDKINQALKKDGCHTCGTRDAGTRSGNAIPDHQPANALNEAGDAQRLYPHCDTCSRRQAGQVTQAKRRRNKD